MNYHEIYNFITYITKDKDAIVNTFYENLEIALIEDKDVIFKLNEKVIFSIFGSFTKKAKSINDNIIFIYRITALKNNEEIDYFGFVFENKDEYLDYQTNINYSFCLDNNSTGKKGFYRKRLKRFPILDITYYNNLKDIVGKETYNLLIDFMLENTNNKIKNVIYKVY